MHAEAEVLFSKTKQQQTARTSGMQLLAARVAGRLGRRCWRGLSSSSTASAPLIVRECAGQKITFHETLPHWIGGQKVFAATGTRSMEKRYPATGETLCKVPVADEATVHHAIASAHEAFMEWSARSGSERGRILSKVASCLYEAHPELARLEVLDTGKPLSESEMDMSGGAWISVNVVIYITPSLLSRLFPDRNVGPNFQPTPCITSADTRRQPAFLVHTFLWALQDSATPDVNPGACVLASARGTTPTRSHCGRLPRPWHAGTALFSSPLNLHPCRQFE